MSTSTRVGWEVSFPSEAKGGKEEGEKTSQNSVKPLTFWLPFHVDSYLYLYIYIDTQYTSYVTCYKYISNNNNNNNNNKYIPSYT